MACCSRLAPALLIHVNLLLCLVAGAGLATAARLKWDPSTYVAVRALFPREYRACAAALCAAAAALLALAHLAAVALALQPSKPRLARALLITYAGAMALGLGLQAAGGAWLSARLTAWLSSERAAVTRELVELAELLRPLLALLARYHPLPDHIKELMEEAEADAPRNLYAAGAALLLALLLQPAAALLALLSARPPPPATRHRADDSISYSIASTDCEKAPLRTAYRNGRLVLL